GVAALATGQSPSRRARLAIPARLPSSSDGSAFAEPHCDANGRNPRVYPANAPDCPTRPKLPPFRAFKGEDERPSRVVSAGPLPSQRARKSNIHWMGGLGTKQGHSAGLDGICAAGAAQVRRTENHGLENAGSLCDGEAEIFGGVP